MSEEWYKEQEKWRNQTETSSYDWVWMISETEQLRRMIAQDNAHQVQFCLRGGIMSRSHCRLDNPRLHAVTPLGTKYKIEEYLDQVELAIDYLTQTKKLRYSEKLEFFQQMQNTLGRTALCLSGGGALAICHAGVIKALLEHDLVPNVVSGTSGGSIVGGYLAIRTNEELLNEIIKPDIVDRHGPLLPPISEMLSRFLRTGTAIPNRLFEETVQKHYGDETFGTAFQKTGRHVSITVTKVAGAGASQKQTSLLLNHLTFPDILIWSAVAASCALPGLLDPVVLMMRAPSATSKEERTEGIPVFPGGVRWRDGSILADIPLSQMRRQFGVNQYIVSQTNPHVSPFAKRHAAAENTTLLEGAENYALEGIKRRLIRIGQSGVLPKVLGQDVSGVLLQSYSSTTEDTIAVLPRLSPLDACRMVLSPDEGLTTRYISLGENATWPKLAHIKQRLRLELCISRSLEYLNEHRSEEELPSPEEMKIKRFLTVSEVLDHKTKQKVKKTSRAEMVQDVTARLHLDLLPAQNLDHKIGSSSDTDDIHIHYRSPSRSPISRPSSPDIFSLSSPSKETQSSPLLTSQKEENEPPLSPGLKSRLASCSHEFEDVTFKSPTWCALCAAFLYGLYLQGKRCKLCQIAAHHGCAQHLQEIVGEKKTPEGEKGAGLEDEPESLEVVADDASTLPEKEKEKEKEEESEDSKRQQEYNTKAQSILLGIH